MNKDTDALIVTEDGSLDLGDSIENIIFHQNLNVIIVTTNTNFIRVFDPHSSQQLSDISLEKYVCDSKIHSMYIEKTGALVICGGENVGLRQDHQGVLLLNTILQTQVSSSDENVTVEILLSEALQLQQAFADGQNLENAAEVKQALAQAIASSSTQGGSNPKVGKWRTVCLTLSLSTLKNVCSSLVNNLRRFSRFIPALSLASALCHRLTHLLGPNSLESTQIDKESMFSEAVRLATFSRWPHMDYKWALPEQMAQAGFFHQPSGDDDRAVCFICNVCLVFWEPTDEPWSEHERHAPSCPFVKGEYTHNVPLSVTCATSPALKHSERSEKIHCLSEANSNCLLFATATKHGTIVVWNISNSLKKEISFAVDPSDPIILDKHFSDTVGYTDIPLSPKEAWVDNDHLVVSPKPLHNDSGSTFDTPSQSVSQSEIQNSWNCSKDSSDVVSGGRIVDYLLNNDVIEIDQLNGLLDTGFSSLDSDLKENSVSGSSQVSFPFEEISGELFAPPRPSHDVRVSSVAIFSDPLEIPTSSNHSQQNTIKKTSRSCLVIGAGLRRYDLFGQRGEFHNNSDGLVKAMNDINQSASVAEKSLDIMKLESTDSDDKVESMEDISSTSANCNSAPSLNSPFFYPKTFVPYLLVYDLTDIAQKNNVRTKIPVPKTVNQGSTKITTSKVIFSTHSAFINPKVPFSICPPEGINGNLSKVTKDGINYSNKKVPKCVQCIPLPHKLNSMKLLLCVKHILTTPCGNYLLVCLQRYNSEGLISVQKKDFNSDSGCVVGGILLYRIQSTSDSLSLQEKPLFCKLFTSYDLIPKEIVIIPNLIQDDDTLENGYAGCVCNDGTLRILSLATLDYIYKLPEEGRIFHNVIYCHSLERLCVSTESGKVVLVQVKRDNENLDDGDTTHTMNVVSSLCKEDSEEESEKSSQSSLLLNNKEAPLKSEDLLVNKGTSEDNLDKCVELTNFQPGCPRYLSTVPPCWCEMNQAQKQRRNPQHLQHQADDLDTTRTWRLEADSTTFDEHIFYIHFSPGSVGATGIQVGHVDIKLNFLPSAPNPLPKIQVTLLKQNHKHVRKTPLKSFDNPSDGPENPVLTKEFLAMHKAEILCGPVTVNEYLDLSGQAANITLTSPALLACSGRIFIVHLKAISPVSQTNSKEKGCSELHLVDQYIPPQSTTLLDKFDKLSPLTKRNETVKGCDVIHELSYTIHCCAKTNIPHERHQRLAIIEKKRFHKELLDVIVNGLSSIHMKQRSLDLLLWVLSVYASESDKKSEGMSMIILLIKENLNAFIKYTLLLGDRSLAHKAAKILILSLESLVEESCRKSFAKELIDSLLYWLEHIIKCQSAGALYWFFSLLNHVKWCDSFATAAKVTELLSTTSDILNKKFDPLQTLLQTRFNLFGTPFERELFDTFPPLLGKQNTGASNNQNANGPNHCSHNSNNNTTYNLNNNPYQINQMSFPFNKIDPLVYSKSNLGPTPFLSKEGYDIGLVMGQSAMASGLTPQIGSLCGLLEVEPLHFNLHMASDGTKMERIFPGWNCSPNPYIAQNIHANGNVDVDNALPAHALSINLSAIKSKRQHNANSVESSHNKTMDGGSVVDIQNKSISALSSKVKSHLVSDEPSSSSLTSSEATPEHGSSFSTHVIEESSANELLSTNSKTVEMLINKIYLSISNTDEGSYSKKKDEPKSDDLSDSYKADPKMEILNNNGVPYQPLLSLPPQQMLVIEKMHSGARRFVVLDFGSPVVLTDVIIPACSDLVSLTIDVWLSGEESDGERLAVASDIGLRTLVLADLQPPLLCRYLKITTLGRYGMMASQCRIPIGAFYGHTVILPWYLQPYQPSSNIISKQTAQTQLTLLSSMVEDVGCRYSLACSKLRSLIQPLKKTTCFSGPTLPSCQNDSSNHSGTELERKITCAYQECILEQQHLNLIVSVVKRLQQYVGGKEVKSSSDAILESPGRFSVSSDKLVTLMQYLLNCLLTLSLPLPKTQVPINLIEWCGPSQAKGLIEHVCISGPRGSHVAVVSLLARLCVSESWWGEFLSSTMVSLFSSGKASPFPAIRVFALLTFLGQRSVQCGRGSHVIDAVLRDLLLHLNNSNNASTHSSEFIEMEVESHLDIQLVSWLLLFLSVCLDALCNPKIGEKDKSKDGAGRWSWLSAEMYLHKKGTEANKGDPKVMRDKLRKRLIRHKKQLVNLECATKSFGEVLSCLGDTVNPKMVKHSEKEFKKIQKQHALKHFKDLCSIRRHETNSLRCIKRSSLSASTPTAAPLKDVYSSEDPGDISFPVDRMLSLSVSQGLIRLMLNSYLPSSIDLFLLSCKVIGGLVCVTRPCLKISEVMQASQLEALLCHTFSLDSLWGIPWALHGITCLLQDLISGERFHESVVIPLNQYESNPSGLQDTSFDTESAENAKSVLDSDFDDSGFTHLHSAVINQHEDIVLLLVEYGTDINVKTDKGNTVLHLAVMKNSILMVEILLKHGANVNMKNEAGLTPLLIAIMNDYHNVASILLKNGAQTSLKGKEGNTALHLAVIKNQKWLVSELVTGGAKVHDKSDDGNTPLHLAALNGSLDIIELLIKFGAKINEKNKKGHTPLYLAAVSSHKPAIEYLLKNGAGNIGEVDGNDQNYLHLAAKLQNFCKKSKTEADNTEKNDTGPSTSSKGNTNISQTDDGATPIEGDTKSEKFLINKGVKSTDWEFLTTGNFTMWKPPTGGHSNALNGGSLPTTKCNTFVLDDVYSPDVYGKISLVDSEDSSESEEILVGDYISDKGVVKSFDFVDSFYCVVNNWDTPPSKNGKDSTATEVLHKPMSSQKQKMEADHSTAIDARLENSISLSAELRLHMMNTIHSSRLNMAVSEPVKIVSNSWNNREVYGSSDLSSSVSLLSAVFYNALSQLSVRPIKNELESIMELWLNLNNELTSGSRGLSFTPLIPLSAECLSLLLSTVYRTPTVSIRCWSLLLQILTLCCNQPSSNSSSGLSSSNTDEFEASELNKTAMAIVSNRNFLPVLQRFLTGNYNFSNESSVESVGSTLTSHFEELLLRLQIQCDIVNSSNENASYKLKLLLLSLLERLLEPNGALAQGIGPMDAQLSFLYILLSMQFEGIYRSPIPLMIINSVACLVKEFLSSVDNDSSESEQGASILGGLFVSVLETEGGKGPAPSRRIILCSLLNLARKLAEISLPQPGSPSSTNVAMRTSESISLTDFLKLEQQRAGLDSSQTDEHKAQVGATGSTHSVFCCHDKTDHQVTYLADSVIQNPETMQLLLHSLGLCEGSSFMMILGAVSGDISEKLSLGETITDALYKLLLFLNVKVTNPEWLVDPLIRYIESNGMWHQPPLSEAIFCFYTYVLDCEKLIKKFAEKGGFKILFRNLVMSVGRMGAGQSGLVTSVMNHLSPPLPQSTIGTIPNKRSESLENHHLHINQYNKRCETETSGLYNFAPLATITSSNPTARPADALVQPSQFFQRTKAPPWPYHFYPYENSVDLNLTLPCPILLHEVHLLPHTHSLGMCPSAVSIEAGIEGYSLTPVTPLVNSAGLTYIRIVLPQPIVASIIVVRLNRPKNQSTLGLSQLKLLGNTTFKEAARLSIDQSSLENIPLSSSQWWLRLARHCICQVPCGLSFGVEASSSVPRVMEACVTLLLTPSQHAQSTFSNCLEATTLALTSMNSQLLATLMKCLLNHPLLLQPTGTNTVKAAVALLYELCVNSGSTEGVELLLDWLKKIIADNHLDDPQNECAIAPIINPEILFCIASILWNISREIVTSVTDDLFRNICNWCEKASGELKEGLDQIIASMCCLLPHLFTQLLVRMGILTVFDSSSTSITDDRKDREAEMRASCTDDMKEGIEEFDVEGRFILQDPSLVSLSVKALQTLGMAARSNSCIHILLDSGFPLLLVHGILEWCKSELLNQVDSCASPTTESATDIEKAAELGTHSLSDALPSEMSECHNRNLVAPFNASLVAQTLETLASLSTEPPMKDWLGSGEGSVFWLPLLTVLGDPIVRGSEINVRCCTSNNDWDKDNEYSHVEDATIYLMRQCINNHPHNQEILSSTLCHLIQRQNAPPPGGLTYLHSLSGFTRRLVLQILLETEHVLVHINTVTGSLYSPPSITVPHPAHHPKFGVGHKTRLLYVPTCTKIEDIIKKVTDWWQGSLCNNSSLNNENGNSSDDGYMRRELGEVGLELVDKLSVAAGVTAKDKRNKDKKITKCQPKQQRKSLLRDKFLKNPKTFEMNEISGNSGTLSSYGLVNDDLLGGKMPLPLELTLAQMMAALRANPSSNSVMGSHLSLNLVQRKESLKENREKAEVCSLLKMAPIPSSLQIFTNQGGLSLLAQHMSLLYPDTSHQVITSVSSKRSTEGFKSSDMDDDLDGFEINYFELGQGIMTNGNNVVKRTAMNMLSISPIPPHALGAFTLFLRLPGFAETLLDTNKACCLLRLALGVSTSAEENNGEINSSSIGSLATLPFQVLEMLLASTPLSTDDGLLLRRTCLTAGALHLILACLTTLSHQDTPETLATLSHPNVPIGLVVATARSSCTEQRNVSQFQNNTENDRCHYWAKGTGYGTGSTTQTWNVEQALNRQKMEEEHVVWLIRLLAQYINPGDSIPQDIFSTLTAPWELESDLQCDAESQASSASSSSASTPSKPSESEKRFLSTVASLKCSSEHNNSANSLPSEIFDLFLNSGLISKIASYLSNDSVLDMSRHVPLYRSLLSLVRGIAVTAPLTPLLTKVKKNIRNLTKGDISQDLPSLLHQMKSTVNTYMNKLKWKSKSVASTPPKGEGKKDLSNDEESVLEEAENDEGLALLVPDIEVSSNVVKVAMEKYLEQEKHENLDENDAIAAKAISEQSFIDIYLSALKPLQFDSYEMIVEDLENGIRFAVPYHYEQYVRNSSDSYAHKRIKRLAQEAVTLSTSLPISFSSSVFLRTDIDRLDVMKVLITGPDDTPYANGCFEFDIHFPPDYPNSPLFINLQTTGEKKVRFNPNLYMDGKVCLSILNTWHGRPEEKWNPQTSSLLQVLVSIQSLILVKEPYFNEPGYERSRGTASSLLCSQEYDANIRTATVRWAILNQIRNPSPCFKDVIHRHFWLKQKEILQQIESWITEMESISESQRVGRVISHFIVALKKLYQLVRNEFSKMVPPEGLEDVKLPEVASKSPVSTPTESTTSQSENGGRSRSRKTSKANLFDCSNFKSGGGEAASSSSKSDSGVPPVSGSSLAGACKEKILEENPDEEQWLNMDFFKGFVKVEEVEPSVAELPKVASSTSETVPEDSSFNSLFKSLLSSEIPDSDEESSTPPLFP